MTPDEIIQELRDLREPAALGEPLPVSFAFEPFIVLAIILIVLGVIWWRRRGLWKVEAETELSTIAKQPAGQRWDALLKLLRRIGRHRRLSPPDFIYRPPGRVGIAEEEALTDHIRKALRG